MMKAIFISKSLLFYNSQVQKDNFPYIRARKKEKAKPRKRRKKKINMLLLIPTQTFSFVANLVSD